MKNSTYLIKSFLNSITPYENPFSANSLGMYITDNELVEHSKLMKNWDKKIEDMTENDINGHMIELILIKNDDNIVNNNIKYADLLYKERFNSVGFEVKSVAYFYKDNSWIHSLYKNIQNYLNHLIEAKKSNGTYFRYDDSFVNIYIVFKQYKKNNLQNRSYYVTNINDIEYAYLGTICLDDDRVIINSKLEYSIYEIPRCVLENIGDTLHHMIREFKIEFNKGE